MSEEVRDAEFEVVRREESPPSVLTGAAGLTPEMVRQVEEAVDLVPRVKAIALRATNHKDWEKFGDKAYLNESGAKKLAQLWGINLKNGGQTEKQETDHAGGVVVRYSSKCIASMKLKNGDVRYVEEIGESDSNDDFFRFRWQNGSRIELPLQERDLASIKKKSYTNAVGRAIKAILGYGNVLWSEVVGNVQDSGKSAQIEFKKASPQKTQTVAGAESGDLKAKLKKYLLDLASGDENQAKALLMQYSAFEGKDGKRMEYKGSIADMSEGWAGSTYKKVKVDWERECGGPREPGMEG